MNDSPVPEPSPFATIAVFVVVTLALIGAGVLLLQSQPQPIRIDVVPPAPTATPSPSPTPAPITVYVTGAVGKPGALVTLPHDSRVQAAIDAAGGAAAGADLERVNLAAILRDGDQVDVPEQGAPAVAVATRPGGPVVRVNTATVEELDTLPDIGPALAQRIVDFRAANGPFKDLQSLDKVEGIGPALLQKLAGLVAFD